MSILRRLLFLLITSSGVVFCRAQSIPKFDIKNILASSPEAAMLGRFGDVPISYYTGTADVSIPLYTLKESGFEIPIVLRYHGSGNKVDDQATNVGLGWSLEPGGAIIQVICGKQDADDNLAFTDGYNFLKNTDPGYPAILTPFTPKYATRSPIGNGLFTGGLCIAPNPNQDTYTTLFDLQQGMGQPDIYQYNFPGGYSGKFYINPENGNIVLLDKKQDITFVKESNGSGWVARTMDGNALYFETIETVYNAGDLSNPQGLTFRLSRIVLHNGKEIDFTYQDGVYMWNQYSESFHSTYPLAMGAGTDNKIIPSSYAALHHIKTLTGITGDNTTVTFNLGSRSDMPVNIGGDPNVQRINSVDIRNAVTGNPVKSFVFNYEYFTSSLQGGSYNKLPNSVPYTPTDAEIKRLKLLSVQEIGYGPSGQVALPPYSFTYDESVQFPLKTSFARDFWGYYNGQNNLNLLPDLTFFYYTNDQNYEATMPVTLLTSYHGANRSPDSTQMKVGLLKKITYPTGGYTMFGYEPNIFGNHSYPDIQKLQTSNRTVSVFDQNLSNAGSTKSASFTFSSSLSINLNLEFSVQSSTGYTFNDLLGSSITISKTVAGVTTPIKTWNMVDYQDQFNNNNGDVNVPAADATVFISYDPAAVYTITADLQDNLGPQTTTSNNAIVRASFQYLDVPGNSYKSYGGGMRVSSIENYTADGTLASRKAINYVNTDNSSSGKLMSPLRSLWEQVMYAIQMNDPNNGLIDQMPVWNISSESAVAFSDGVQGNVVGYSRVEEVELAPNNTTKGKHVYTYTNSENQNQFIMPDDPNPLNGMISTDEIYNNTSPVPLEKTTYNYTSLENTAFSGYKVSPAYLGPLNVGCDQWCFTPGGVAYQNASGGTTAALLDYYHNMWINIYPLHGYWYLPSSKLLEKTENGVTMTSTETYSYNSKGQLVRTDTYDSKGQKRSTLNLFPVDNPGDPMSAQLINLNLFDNIQQQRSLLNDATELSKSYVYYRMENSQAVQDHITRSYTGAAPFTEVTFDKYFNYKVPYQVSDKSITTCLLWSFNYTKPIAQIVNATSATVESVLGAANILNFAANPNPGDADINNFLAPLWSSAALSSAQITTYTYRPQIGVATMTNMRGQTTYYEYDPFGRLQDLKDKDGNIIKTIDYHYKGQQ